MSPSVICSIGRTKSSCNARGVWKSSKSYYSRVTDEWKGLARLEEIPVQAYCYTLLTKSGRCSLIPKSVFSTRNESNLVQELQFGLRLLVQTNRCSFVKNVTSHFSTLVNKQVFPKKINERNEIVGRFLNQPWAPTSLLKNSISILCFLRSYGQESKNCKLSLATTWIHLHWDGDCITIR